MATTTELETQLQLSLIYKRLLDKLYTLAYTQGPYAAFRGEHYQNALTMTSEAFAEAIKYLSTKCPLCDSSDVTMCENCHRNKHCAESHYGECL